MTKFNNPNVDTTKDTGWGLIFRLNDLLNDLERLSVQGKYDDWNFKLDRIYSNLLYRNELDIKLEDGIIEDIKLCEDDTKIKNYFDLKIKQIKRKMRLLTKNEEVINKAEYNRLKNELYNTILLKEIWLRKFMNELKLYIKELKKNPAGSMWGK